jgi:hypothetical protein
MYRIYVCLVGSCFISFGNNIQNRGKVPQLFVSLCNVFYKEKLLTTLCSLVERRRRGGLLFLRCCGDASSLSFVMHVTVYECSSNGHLRL